MGLPKDWCVAGFIGAALLSNPANGWVGGAYFALLPLMPVFMTYLAVRMAVSSERQLRWLISALLVLTLFQALSGVFQYHTGTGFGGSLAFDQRTAPAEEDEDDPAVVRRVRGTGIFEDPNDLAMALVIVFPFLMTGILDSSSGLARRTLTVAAAGLLVYALVLTQSRGGIVGLGALTAAYFWRRFRSKVAIAAAVAIVGAVLLAGPSRLQEMDAAEGSAQGRVQAWSAGLQMLKSHPILGVGYGQFLDYHERVAHSSFVHSFADTGVVGGLFFVGAFYWFFLGNGARRDVSGAAASPLARDIWASGIGLTATACFLSRQYSPILFVPLALGAARIELEARPGSDPAANLAPAWKALPLVAIAVVVAHYVIVRLLAVWSS
jgi:hypothetical protein